jgi:hypothetical protein
MATSPRNELVIESVTVFGRFPDGFVWAEHTNTADGPIADSGHKAFATLAEAVTDFFEDRGIDLSEPVDPEDAHYSLPVPSGDDEHHIRRYRYGAPEPIQATRPAHV